MKGSPQKWNTPNSNWSMTYLRGLLQARSYCKMEGRNSWKREGGRERQEREEREREREKEREERRERGEREREREREKPR